MGIITSEHGAWTSGDKQETKFCRLDNWQDDMGRRMRLANNPYGSTHPEATLLEALGWPIFYIYYIVNSRILIIYLIWPFLIMFCEDIFSTNDDCDVIYNIICPRYFNDFST